MGAQRCIRPRPPLQCEHMFVVPHSPPERGGMPGMDLTKRQQEIFDFIRKYSAKYGYPPTVRDIGKAVGLGLVLDGARPPGEPREDRAAATRPVQAARDRAARPGGRQARWTACGASSERKACRCVGSVAAGQPMLAEENIEEYVVDPRNRGRRGWRVRAAHPRRLDEGRRHPRGRLRGRASAGHGHATARSSWRCWARRRP